jgi:hypothetical protein
MKHLRFIIAATLLFVLACGWLSQPSTAQQSVIVPATTNQIAMAGSTYTITKIITGITGKQIYVTAIFLAPVATSVVTFSYGTGTNCGTGTTVIGTAMTFSAGQTLSIGTGNGAVMVIPSGNDLCATVATAAAPGFLSYALF